MSFVCCNRCGEVADRDLVRICPGCWEPLPEIHPDHRPRIPAVQQEAQRDIGITYWAALFGVIFVWFVASSVIGAALGIGSGFLVVFFVGVVFLFVVLGTNRTRPTKKARNVLVTILGVVLAGAGIAVLLAVGAFVIIFVMCLTAFGA